MVTLSCQMYCKQDFQDFLSWPRIIVHVLKTLEYPWISGVGLQGLESTWNRFLVHERFLIFVELDRNILPLISFKVNRSQGNQMLRWKGIKFSKCLQNVWLKLFPVPLGTLAHVHWTTHARWISGLHARVFKLLLSGVFANAGVYAQHKHFAWLEVNSYKAKSLKFQSRILESPCKVLNKHVYELWFHLKTNSAISWD